MSFASSLMNYLAFNNFTFYFNYKLGLLPHYIGIALVIFSIWNTINDPIFGYLEDKTKTSIGRRIPYLRFASPFFSLFFILLWIPLVDTNNQIALFSYLLFILFALDTFSTIIGVATYILPAEMAVSSKARGSLMVFGGLFNSLSQFFSFVIPAILLTGDVSGYIDPSFIVTMIIIGILSGALMVYSSFHLKENEYTCMEDCLPFFEGLIETFKNKNFVVFEVGNTLTWIAITMISTGTLYYIESVLKLSDLGAMIPLLAFFLAVFLFIPIYNILLKKKGVKFSFMTSLFTGSFAFMFFLLIGGNLIGGAVGLFIAGTSISGYYLLSQLILSDVVDYDEIRTERRREATYAGVHALITKPTSTIAPYLFLAIIYAFGFNENLTAQSIPAQFGILFGMSIVPGLFFLLAGIIMKFYELSGPDWVKQKEDIKKVHEKKEATYLKELNKES